MNWNMILYIVLNTAFVFLFAPLLISLIKKVKALCQGRRGTPLLQTYFQLFKLFKKEIIYSDNSSFIQRISPYLNIAFLLVASIFVPIVFIPAQESGFGNIILFLYLMVCARFFMALSGLDAEAPSAAWEVRVAKRCIDYRTYHTHGVRPSLLFKTTDIPQMFGLNGSILQYLPVAGVFAFIFCCGDRQCGGCPNHLELTMVHEAMILEQSGPKLALMELSYGIKQLILMALLINIIFPWGLATDATVSGILISVASFIVKAVILAVAIGVFESFFAKIRFFRLPDFFIIAFFLSFATILFELLS